MACTGHSIDCHGAGNAAASLPTRGRRHQGFTLLEVLVAIVVLSFGVLGVVGLQAASLQANKEAKYQSSAVRLARELADLMRGNKATAIGTGTANPYLINWPTTALSGPPPNCTTSACSPTGLAQSQMADWVARVNSELPGARIVVCFDDDPFQITGSGLARWGCGAGATYKVVVVKIGWSRQSTNRGATGATAIETATSSNPLVVLPVQSGV